MAVILRERGSPPKNVPGQLRRRRLGASRAASVAVRRVEDAADRIVAAAERNEERASSIAPIVSAVADLAESPTLELETIVEALEQPAILEQLRRDNPLLPARLRGIRAKQRLLQAEGGVVSGQEFADLVGVSRQAIDKRRRHGTLIGLALGKKGYVYPVWQAEVGLGGLKPVFAALSEYGPWTQAVFMLTPNTWLGGETPLDRLRQGDTETVVAAARMYGEQTASSIVPEPNGEATLRDPN
jgi:hypothetical protein